MKDGGGLFRARWAAGLGVFERTIVDHGDLEKDSGLSRWRNTAALRDEASWCHFLRSTGISEEKLRRAIDQQPSAVREQPAWVQEAIRLASRDSSRTKGISSVVKPWVIEARRRLAAQVKNLDEPKRPRIGPAVIRRLSEKLEDELLELAVRPIILEAEIADRAGGGRPAYDEALRYMARPGGRLELFGHYPGLPLALSTASERWLNVCGEFLSRMLFDWDALTSHFNLAGDEMVTSAWFADSDPHDNGQRVIVVGFRGSSRLVYKPRSLAVFAIYQNLLQWLNERGFSPPFERQAVLDRGQWGWVAFVRKRGCRRKQEVVSFYRRLGGQLALLQLLGATDCHHENLIADGEHPQIIDLETLFKAELQPAAGSKADKAAFEFVAESVLSTGILPCPTLVNEKIVDLSGIGAKSYQETSLNALSINTDTAGRVRVNHGLWRLGRTYNRPRIRGVEADPTRFETAICEGFQDVYERLLIHRDDVVCHLKSFAGTEVRVVMRPTAFYSELLRDSHHPTAMYDGVERDLVLTRLWVAPQGRAWLKSIVGEEFRQLRRGDIPFFRATSDGKEIYAKHKQTVLAVSRSGLDAAHCRLDRLNAADLKRQLALIACSTKALEPFQRTRGVCPPSELEPLSLACSIGERLLEEAVYAGGNATWLAKRSSTEPPCPRLGEATVRLIASDLYSGLSGIIVFLSHLFKKSGDRRFGRLAEAAARTLYDRINEGDLAERAGAFDGLSGAAYAFAHLAWATQEPLWLRSASEQGRRALGLAKLSKQADIISGLSGVVLVQMVVHSICQDQSEELLRRSVERLISEVCTRTPPHLYLRGASHGHSGAVWALSAAASFCDGITSHLSDAIERELDLTRADNWTDPGDDLHIGQSTWCHGPAGVALCRAAAGRAVGSRDLLNGADDALRAARAVQLPEDLGLCHGVAGVMEAELFSRNDTTRISQHRLAEGVLRLSAGAERELLSSPKLLDFSLMTGLSGIGMLLLRLIDPTIPSALLLQPPKSRE